MGDGETLHYQSVVPDAGTDGDAAAEGFFDLANARCVRYTVAVGEREAREGRGGGEGDGETNEASGSSRADASEVELVVEQDQSLHDSCGGIVWESAYALEQYMRLNIGRICASPPVKRKRGLSRCKVLELGAGAGLLGLAVAARGAKATVLTDHPNAMPLLERNVRRNSALFETRAELVGKKRKKRGDANADTETTTTTTSKSGIQTQVHAVGLDERRTRGRGGEEGPFDIILATDVVFNESLVTPLLDGYTRVRRTEDSRVRVRPGAMRGRV